MYKRYKNLVALFLLLVSIPAVCSEFYCLYFDGVDDKVALTKAGTGIAGCREATIELWFWYNNDLWDPVGNATQLIFIGATGAPYYQECQISIWEKPPSTAKNIQVGWRDSDTTAYGLNYSGFQYYQLRGRWHHLATTWKTGDRARLYLDGAQVDSIATGTKPLAFNQSVASIGDYPSSSGNSFMGYIADVVISSRCKAVGEIKGDYCYRCLMEPLYTGAYHTFNYGAGTLLDSSLNGDHVATITSAPVRTTFKVPPVSDR